MLGSVVFVFLFRQSHILEARLGLFMGAVVGIPVGVFCGMICADLPRIGFKKYHLAAFLGSFVANVVVWKGDLYAINYVTHYLTWGDIDQMLEVTNLVFPLLSVAACLACYWLSDRILTHR